MLKSTTSCFVLLALLAVPRLAFGEEPAATGNESAKTANEDKHPFKVLVLDPDGKPVADAQVGKTAFKRTNKSPDWQFAGLPIGSDDSKAAVTDVNGETQLFADEIFPNSGVLVARMASRKLVGIKLVSRNELLIASENKSVVPISLEPEVRIHGHLQSVGTEKLNRPFKWTDARLKVDGRLVFRCLSQREYEFFVPKGSYIVAASSMPNTLTVSKSITVPAGSPDIELETMDLPPSNLVKLIGQPAPEIADVVAWKNSEPLKMADLRGKYVLLEFFGYWCGPCVYQMPKVFELHDQFSKRGLVIIGVHVGSENDSIDSGGKLDAKLAEVRKELWAGRDLPFPVAMVAFRRQNHSDSEQPAACQAAVDYGVQAYPSQVLIDPEGKVIGWFFEKEHVKLFEALPEVE